MWRPSAWVTCPDTHFVQANALKLPFRDGAFDAILSEGALHHTRSTRAALLTASRVLAPDQEFHFYVYRRKGPVAEFTDDYIRQQIAPLSEAEAWEAMRSLTHLGQAFWPNCRSRSPWNKISPYWVSKPGSTISSG